jgi:hypothetical protein
MSNSYRKTPIIGMTMAASDKRFKKAEHRRERASVKIAVRQAKDAPDPKLFGNPWAGEKDGKRYFTGHPKLLRK